ncbi:MAG: hypothetical protein ACHQUC_08555 [Chlamydiales bacterium]
MHTSLLEDPFTEPNYVKYEGQEERALIEYEGNRDYELSEEFPSISASIYRGNLRGRSFGPVNNRMVGKFLLINGVGLGTLATLAYFLAKEVRNPNPNQEVLYTYLIGLGASARVIIESSITVLKAKVDNPRIQQAIAHLETLLNFNGIYCVEIFLILYNIGLKIPNGCQITNEIVLPWSAFTLVKDVWSLFTLSEGYRREPVQIVDNRQIINHRIVPSSESVYGQAGLNLITTAVGVSLLAVGGFHVTNDKYQPVLFVFGSFLVAKVAGDYFMQCVRKMWGSVEQRCIEGSWIVRTIGNYAIEISFVGTLVGADLISPEIFIPIMGGLYGVARFLIGREVEILTLDEVAAEKENLQYPIVHQIAQAVFFTSYTLFFGWQIASSPGARLDPSIVLSVTLISIVFSRVAYRYFKPGKSGRCLCEMVFRTLYNPYSLLAPLYLFRTISNIDSLNSTGPSMGGQISNIVAKATFGAIYGGLQAKPPQRKPAFTSPLYKILILYIILSIFAGAIGQVHCKD